MKKTVSMTINGAPQSHEVEPRLLLVHYPAHPLASRVWELRNKLTAYDATFIALGDPGLPARHV